MQNHLFDDNTVRRGFQDQLRPTKAPRGAKMTPKRDPRSIPKRPKTDIKINLNFDAKTKMVGEGSARRLWAGTPPQGAAPGRPRGPRRRPKRHGTGPQAPMRALKDQKKYTIIQVYKYTVYKYTVYRYTGHLYTVYCYTGYMGIQYKGYI